jgi:hypothetical protein
VRDDAARFRARSPSVPRVRMQERIGWGDSRVLHRCKAAEAPAEASSANFFSCDKFGSARRAERARAALSTLRQTRACKIVVFEDIKETRISWAFSRCADFLVENCVTAKVFGKVSWYRSSNGRDEAAQTEIYTEN